MIHIPACHELNTRAWEGWNKRDIRVMFNDELQNSRKTPNIAAVLCKWTNKMHFLYRVFHDFRA